MNHKKTMIIIPTFNEKENIAELISQICSLNPKIFITVVDDNSPDGTGKLVEGMAGHNQKIHVIHREKKLGLGTAYLKGFRYALAQGVDYIISMDADFSHDPKYIPDMLRLIQTYDVVLGSRYINGVRVQDWSFKRLLLSKFANLYIKFILGLPIEDCTSGFKCYSRRVLEALNLERIKSHGHAFQIEMVFWIIKKGFKIVETPIIFSERVRNKTKISRVSIIETFLKIFELKFIDIIER